MMPLTYLLQELQRLQRRLQEAANRLWKIETTLNRFRQRCLDPTQFLPRRLRALHWEAQAKLDFNLGELSLLLRSNFPRGLVRISRPEEARSAAQIRTLLRSIQNAYITDLPMRESLESLRRSLPR